MGFFQTFAAPSVAQPVKATVDTAHLSAASGAMLAHMTTAPNIFSSSINAGAPSAPQPASATAPNSGFFAPRLDPLPASAQPASPFPLPLVLGGAAALIAVGLVVYKLKKKKR